MKMRTIKLSAEFLMERLAGKASSLTSNLPSDAELLDIKYDPFTGQIQAIVRSDSFEDVADAYPIPEFELVYSTSSKASAPSNDKTAPLLVAAPQKTKPESALLPKPAIEVVKKAQIPKKPNTSLLEEEFSMEQRKLLSFSVDGDFLVVKPVKFLKAEWEDINEVVRSLGGRWVKGDIISYWEIPVEQT